ncbi:MAG: hypothetical protein ACR2RE_18930 [Geminicoccaceae bacterium]
MSNQIPNLTVDPTMRLRIEAPPFSKEKKPDERNLMPTAFTVP